ncbi:hypothetical protein VTJ49DRAFT_5887 [Mycothermus thermophilus]|uniref:Folliculin-interacting protein N-terminal domain-containing protein n=1 Tax=Humicola insolens TaxID=85995 RepID=A0ABR3VLD5_HUMIN
MLGKLFNLGASAGSGSGPGAVPSPQSSSHRSFPLESVQEDMHTRHLLFPDPQDLYEYRANQLYPLSGGPAITPTGSLTAAFDYSTDIDLDVRDVRIIIMQDALSSVAASLLYDSQPAPPMATASLDRPSATAGSSYSVQEPRRNPVSPRKPSIGYSQRPPVPQPGSPKMRHQPTFDRRPSVHSRGQACAESESQRAWREYREELATFSSCIFGNSELMAYKGTSTKVHVVPSDVRPADSFFGDGRGSFGRSTTTRASRLSQSFTSENPPMFPHAPSLGGPGRAPDRKKVLITRLFPVNLPLDEDITTTRLPDDVAASGFPGPQGMDDVKARRKFQPRQKRTPMYAVALIITLPPSPAHSAPATLRSGMFRGPGSYAEQDSFPSSFGSARRSGWTVVGHGSGLGTSDSFDTSYGSDVEDHIDAITRHWDIIMRTLSHLQSVVASTLFAMLRQVDLASPDPAPSISMAARGLGRRGEDGQTPPPKVPKTNAKHITLLPNCLLDNRNITAEIDAAKTRIVAGIRASRVATGQNRWPIWREEARWVARWAGSKEQGFFFYNLLTGFLATHTDWLQALSPPAYRCRHFVQQQQQRGRSDEDALLVPARTVILSDDKIAARRLVFLLSSFLPASQHLPGVRAHRPSTPASFGALSQSPPSFVVPILKEESLRRKINRRATGARVPSHSRNLSLQTQSGARSGAVPPPLAHLSMDSRHERRASDAASIRTSHLPIRGSDPITRKSSVAATATTTATVTPETSIPHFSIVHRPDMFGQGRPGSSNSVAADDLKRLARDESPGSQGSGTRERRQSSRWSVLSGFWNGRRRDSTSRSPVFTDAQDVPPVSPAKSRQPSATGNARPALTPEPTEAGRDISPHNTLTTGLEDPDLASTDATAPCERPGSLQRAKRTPAPSGAFESPVKTSINLDDGVIDVDVPLPDFVTSFESAVSSPSSSGYLSASGFGTGLDAFEHLFRFATDGDGPLNAAGWLQHYHPDFVLQALPAQQQQPNVMDEIKASMRAEPTPPLPATPSSPGNDTSHATERWVNVSSALVADTTTFTITRIRYRRLVRLRQQPGSGSSPTTSGGVVSSAASFMSSSNPPPPPQPLGLDPPLRDEFIEEPIVTFDDVLTEAVERVIAAPGTWTVTGTETTVSKVNSASSSRSTSKRRGREKERDRDRETRTESLSVGPPASGSTSASRSARTSMDLSRPAGFDADNNPNAAATTNKNPDQSRPRSSEPTPVRGLGVPSSVLLEYHQQEVPRSQCKTVLLTALEDIIHDVVADREEEEEEETLEEREEDSRRGEGFSVGETESPHQQQSEQQGQQQDQDQVQEQEQRLLKRRQQKQQQQQQQRARDRERESPLREAVRGWMEGLDGVVGVE